MISESKGLPFANQRAGALGQINSTATRNHETVAVTEHRLDVPGPPCYIERLPPELLEQILSTLISLGDDDYLPSRAAVKVWVLVSHRWTAVASRLALVHVQISTRLLTDQIIEHAYRILKEQGGWAATRVLRVRHIGKGDIHRLSELIELFGRTLYILDLTITRWKSPAVEISGLQLKPIEGEILFPELRSIKLWGLFSNTVHNCLRNCDPTRLTKVTLCPPMAGGPPGGYLSGMIFPKVEDLRLGTQPFGRKGTLEDLGASTPGLKTLRLGVSNGALEETVNHMERTWPKSLRHLEVLVWDLSRLVGIDHPLIMKLATVAEDNEVEFLEITITGD